MKFTIILILFLSTLLFAQQNNLVEYQFVKLDGHNEIQNEYLVFNDSALYYVNITNEAKLNFEDDKLPKNRFNYEPIYVNLINDTIYQQRLGIKESNSSKIEWFVLSEAKPQLNWKITKETQKILGYTTYKATTKFRGRNYTAWFTPDLSYNYGPWKLHGLPGLILKAETEQFSYEAKRIVLNSNQIKELSQLKKLQNWKNKYTFSEIFKIENNWLEYNRANIYASFPPGVKIQEKPLRADVRELTLDE